MPILSMTTGLFLTIKRLKKIRGIEIGKAELK